MARLFLAFVVLLAAVMDQLATASTMYFPACKAPIHDAFRNYFLMYNSYSERDAICMHYANATMAESTRQGKMDLPVRCGMKQRLLSTVLSVDLTSTCERQVRNKQNSVGSDKACNLEELLGEKRGLHLTGQSDSEAVDQAYATHMSFVCLESYGTNLVPTTTVARCVNGDWLTRIDRFSLSTDNKHSCKRIVVSPR